MFRLPVSLGLVALSALIFAGPAGAETIYISVPRAIYDLYPLPKCVQTHPESVLPDLPEPFHNLGVCIQPA